MQILRSAAYQRMPWKNGGGETFEIAVSPPQATFDTMDWRISMALVTQDGPFSLLPGIDRTLTVLEGPSLILDFGPGQEMQQLAPGSPPFPFAADVPVEGRIAGGAITDLNVMTRRGRYRHRVHHQPITAPLSYTSVADTVLVFCAQGDVRIEAGDQGSAELGERDGALLYNAGPARAVTLTPSGAAPAAVYFIELYRIAS